MLDGFLTTSGSPLAHPDVPDALEQAAGAIARLDQALDGHPLLPAFLYRARLDAVRRQAAVDGHGIDPWHLAAVLEGLRLRMEGALRIIDRGMIFEAARTALTHHQWLVDPDFDQEGEIQAAEHHLAKSTSPGALLTATRSVPGRHCHVKWWSAGKGWAQVCGSDYRTLRAHVSCVHVLKALARAAR